MTDSSTLSDSQAVNLLPLVKSPFARLSEGPDKEKEFASCRPRQLIQSMETNLITQLMTNSVRLPVATASGNTLANRLLSFPEVV